MMRRKLRQSFPYKYEVVDCFDGFDCRDPNIETFYDRYHVIRNLGDCVNDVFDMCIMAKMLQRHDMFDPTTCYQNAEILFQFAGLVFSGRVVLRKPGPDRAQFVATRQPTESQKEEPKERSEEEPEKGWIEIWLTDGPEEPLSAEPYILRLADGEVVEGELDADGYAHHDDLLPGRLTIEFPGLFDVCEMAGGKQVNGPNRGKPRLPRQPRPPRHVGWAPEAEDRREDDDDDFDETDLFDDDDRPLVLSDDDSAEDEGEDEQDTADVPPDVDPDFVEQRPDAPDDVEFEPKSPRGSEPDTYAVSLFRASTGGEYHFAVLFCISVRLLKEESGDWYREPVEYEIKDPNGESVITGTSEEGIVFFDGVGSECHELVIGEQSFQVSPCADAWDYEEIYLASENES